MDKPFDERMQRVEELIAAIQQHGNPVVRASAVEMVRALLDVHRASLARILEQLAGQGEPGQAILNELLRDDLVSRLLLLHGLHPVALETRLRHAIDRVRPLLLRHGATVELCEATHDRVQMRVKGGDEVRRLIENAVLEAAPDVLRLEFVDADAATANLIPLPLVRES